MTRIKMQYSSDIQIDDAIHWCKNKFGYSSYPITGNHGWAVVRPGEFRFKNEEDAVLFVLRWV